MVVMLFCLCVCVCVFLCVCQSSLKVGKTNPVMIRSNQEALVKLFEKYSIEDELVKTVSFWSCIKCIYQL